MPHLATVALEAALDDVLRDVRRVHRLVTCHVPGSLTETTVATLLVLEAGKCTRQ